MKRENYKQKSNESVHIISIIVDNESGVLARVIGLFAGRGYNIASLTVSPINSEETVSRITLETIGTDMIVEQIKAQLGRLVPVHSVRDLSASGAYVEKEVILLKFIGAGKNRREALRIADVFRAKVVDTTLKSFVFTLTGSSKKLNSFVKLLRSIGKIEISRSGLIALERGENCIEIKNINT